MKILERERELEQEAQEAKAKEAPKISIGGDGFSFGSAKGDFAVQLKGVLQVDSRTFFDEPGDRRAMTACCCGGRGPSCKGTVFRDFDFLFVPDFAPSSGPTIFDAYVNYRYSPALQFQAGKFKVPVGLEQLQADRDILFNERSLATDLVPNRDVGFELHGDLFDGRVSYAAGIFNGTTDGGNSGNVDFADDRALRRAAFLPAVQEIVRDGPARVWIWGGGQLRDHVHDEHRRRCLRRPAAALPGYFTDGQQQFFAYNPADKAVVVARRRPLAAFAPGVLLLRAVRFAGRIRHFRSEGEPDGGGAVQFRAPAQHGLGSHRFLGVDGGGCRLRRRGGSAAIRSIPPRATGAPCNWWAGMRS